MNSSEKMLEIMGDGSMLDCRGWYERRRKEKKTGGVLARYLKKWNSSGLPSPFPPNWSYISLRRIRPLAFDEAVPLSAGASANLEKLRAAIRKDGTGSFPLFSSTV